MTEYSKQIFSTDKAACDCFGSLEPLDFDHYFEFRASNFGFIKAPYGGCSRWNWHSDCKAIGSTGGFLLSGILDKLFKSLPVFFAK
jgi:hypothetical protein